MPSVLILPQGTRLVECTTQGVRLDTQGFIWELCNGYLHLSRYSIAMPPIHSYMWCGCAAGRYAIVQCNRTPAAPSYLFRYLEIKRDELMSDRK